MSSSSASSSSSSSSSSNSSSSGGGVTSSTAVTHSTSKGSRTTGTTSDSEEFEDLAPAVYDHMYVGAEGQQVFLYVQSNYEGVSVGLSVGTYEEDELHVLGKTVLSAKVPPGFIVDVYQDPKRSGRTHRYYKDIPEITFGFVSSVSIQFNPIPPRPGFLLANQEDTDDDDDLSDLSFSSGSSDGDSSSSSDDDDDDDDDDDSSSDEGGESSTAT